VKISVFKVGVSRETGSRFEMFVAMFPRAGLGTGLAQGSNLGGP
jgi:hypothetical protein